MPQKYSGSCHCGKVRYEVNLDLKQVVSCNCSICSKKGSLLAFGPREALTILSGEDNLSDYQFAKKNIHHLFCKTCGIPAFGWGTGPGGKGMCSINVRCLEGVDLDSLPVVKFDGKKL